MTDSEHEPELPRAGDSRRTSFAGEYEDYPSGKTTPIKLFVGSLPYNVEENDLVSIFDKFGEIVEFSILRDRLGKSRGCAALSFVNDESAEACIKTLHNKFCCGNVPTPLQVKYFQKREHAPVMCFIQGLPYSFAPHALWSSLSARYGPVVNVLMDPTGNPYAAYVSFFKKSSAFALCNDSRSVGIFVDGMLCPSTQVTIMKFPDIMTPMIPSPLYPTFPSGPQPFACHGSPQVDAAVQPPASAVFNDDDREDPAMKLFVGCLPYSKTAQDIADLFSSFGTLIEVAILTDYNGKSRGAAFVTFSKTSEANSAVRELSGFCFPKSTRPINISFAYKQSAFMGAISLKPCDHVTCASISTDPNTPVCQAQDISEEECHCE